MTRPILLLLTAVSLCAYAQENDSDTIAVPTPTEEVDTIFAVVPTPVLSIGLSGGVTFINPENINSHIEYENTVFNTDVATIRTPAEGTLWLTYRPKNLPTFLTLRAEYVSSTREFHYQSDATAPGGGVTGTVTGTTGTTYTIIPLSINSGAVMLKTRMKAEIGFIYALASIEQETSIDGGGTTTTSYTGDGYGFRAGLQQVMPLDRNIGATIEFSYRYLQLREFRDSRGAKVSSLEADYSGVSILVGLSYGF